MKYLLLLIFFGITIQPSRPSVASAAAVVANTAVQVAIEVLEGENVALNNIQAANSTWMKYHEMAKTATGWIDDMKSIQLIIQLIDNMMCTMHRTTSLMSIGGGTSSCHINLKYQIATMNYSYATDVFQKVFVVSKLITMSSEGRMATLKQITTALQESIKEFDELNKLLEGNVLANMQQHMMETQYEQAGASWAKKR